MPRARSVAHQVDQHVHALIVDDARRLVRARARARARVGNRVRVRVKSRLGAGELRGIHDGEIYVRYTGDIWKI